MLTVVIGEVHPGLPMTASTRGHQSSALGGRQTPDVIVTEFVRFVSHYQVFLSVSVEETPQHMAL